MAFYAPRAQFTRTGHRIASRNKSAGFLHIVALALHIAVFPILADVVEVKIGSWSTAHWSNDFIRLNKWLRTCFAQLITLLDIDGIGQNGEESKNAMHFMCNACNRYAIASCRQCE